MSFPTTVSSLKVTNLAENSSEFCPVELDWTGSLKLDHFNYTVLEVGHVQLKSLTQLVQLSSTGSNWTNSTRLIELDYNGK